MVFKARLHHRPIQLFLNAVWNRKTQGLNHIVIVTKKLCLSLLWWMEIYNLLLGLPLSPPQPQVVIITDVSLRCWGGVIVEMDGAQVKHMCQGTWSQLQMVWHINILEMRAVFMVLKQFLSLIANKSVLIHSDNTTVCSYMNKLGGTRFPHFCQEVTDLLDWCWLNKINLTLLHISGEHNFLTHVLTRQPV